MCCTQVTEPSSEKELKLITRFKKTPTRSNKEQHIGVLLVVRSKLFPLYIQSLRSNNAILRCASTPHAYLLPALPVPPTPNPTWRVWHNPPPANGAALCYRIASPCFTCSLYLQKKLCAVPGSSHICCLKHLYREQNRGPKSLHLLRQPLYPRIALRAHCRLHRTLYGREAFLLRLKLSCHPIKASRKRFYRTYQHC